MQEAPLWSLEIGTVWVFLRNLKDHFGERNDMLGFHWRGVLRSLLLFCRQLSRWLADAIDQPKSLLNSTDHQPDAKNHSTR